MESTKYKLIDFENDKIFRRILGYIVIFVGLIYLGLKNYLIFHTMVELYSTIIAFVMVTLSFNAYSINKDDKIIFLGIAYGFIAVFDLLHMFTYKGMGTFADDSTNIPIQLWIVARYMESLSFLIYVTSKNKKPSIKKTIYIYAFISILILISIFYFKIFPDCYITEYGLTPFKIISEYIICVILLFTILFFLKLNYENINKNNVFIIYSLITDIVAEMFFVFYIDVYNISNILGHIFALHSYYFIYIILARSCLKEPHFELVELNNLLDNKNRNLEKLIYHLKLECDERRRLEAENLRKTEVLGAILEASVNGLLVIRNDRKIIHANKLFMEMWNVSSEEVFNGSLSKLIFAAKNQLYDPSEMDELIKRLLQEQDYFTLDLHLKNSRIIEVSSVLYIDKGVSRGKLISFRDITERNKIIELQKQIEIKQISLEKAKEFDELKTNFFSTVSHEFRTPINIILGIIQLLPHMSNEDEEIKSIPNKYIAMIKQNCYRLIKLANNLIDITKIDSGFMKMELKNNNIVSIIEDITLSVVEYSNIKGISLIFDTEVEEIIIACDVDKIERVMLNLLSNAVKFVEPGGKIEVNIKKEEDNVIILVRDNGIGIPKDMTEVIFDRFKQVDSTLRRKKEGSGIGLSIAKSVVEMHGGTISLKSQIGKGSEFTIQLPIRIIGENSLDNVEYRTEEINVDKINIEFSDIYELNHKY